MSSRTTIGGVSMTYKICIFIENNQRYSQYSFLTCILPIVFDSMIVGVDCCCCWLSIYDLFLLIWFINLIVKQKREREIEKLTEDDDDDSEESPARLLYIVVKIYSLCSNNKITRNLDRCLRRCLRSRCCCCCCLSSNEFEFELVVVVVVDSACNAANCSYGEK